MFKKLLKILFVLVFLFIFVGCGKKEPEKEIVKYIVTFDVDGITEEVKVEEGKFVSIPSDPYKDGYNFVGWFLNDTEYDFGPVNENITVKAKFEERIIYHTVIFVDEDDVELLRLEIKHGDGVPDEDYPKIEGYKLVEMDQDLSKIEKDVTVKCVFKQIHTVYVYDYLGNLYTTLEIIRGQEIGSIDYIIESDNRFKYEVVEWYKDAEMTKSHKLSKKVTSDLSLYPQVNAIPLVESYNGMTVSILGDSISTFYSSGSDVNSYYSGSNQFYYPLYSSTVLKASNTWWYQAIAGTGTKLGINNSWSGSNLYGTGTSAGMNIARIKTLGENGTPDIIIVFLGTNDNVNGVTFKNFELGYKTMFNLIEKNYPNAYVMCFTLGYSAFNDYYYTEERRIEYNKITEAMCKQYKAKVIDIAKIQTVDTYTLLLGDRLHPNAEGMKKIAEKVIASMNEFFADGTEIN